MATQHSSNGPIGRDYRAPRVTVVGSLFETTRGSLGSANDQNSSGGDNPNPPSHNKN